MQLTTDLYKINILNETIEGLINKINSLERLVNRKTTAQSVEKLNKKIEVPKEVDVSKTIIEETPIIKEIPKKDPIIIVEKPKIVAEKVVPIIVQDKEQTQKIKSSPKPRKTLSDILQQKIDDFKKNNPDMEKFIGESLVSKIGILILVLGISFFVKFAIDNNWINEVGRVGIGLLSGSILLAFAHRLKKNYKGFSSILASGAIVIFYFVITYAFKEYQLFDQTTTFVLLVIITVFSVLISLLYDRKELGILSLIGGFSVPLLISNGSGNYIFLFSYLLILNIGFLILSIKKRWFIINILSFIFTHLFFVAWLMDDVNIKEHASNLFIFASLFYIVFYFMNLVRVIKEKEYALKPLVMTLFLISTFVYFAQGLFLLGEVAPQFKGGFTLLLALINLGSGWILLKRKIVDKSILYIFIGMTLTFLTLTGPIQLEGNYITLFWAAESTLLIWLSQKIKHNGFKIPAIITLFLMLISLLMDFDQIYRYGETLQVIFNKGFITGIFAVFTLGLSSFLLFKEKERYRINEFNYKSKDVAIVLLIIAGVILYITGLLELTHQVKTYFSPDLAQTITMIYHYIFVSLGVYFAFKNKSEMVNKTGLLVGGLALVVGVLFLTNVPFSAYVSSKFESVANPTFYVQFIFLFLLLFLLFLSYRALNSSNISDKNKNFLNYAYATLFVVLMSIELLLISKPVFVDAKLASLMGENMDLVSTINNAQKTVIKSGFPILWGLLSFIFLYIGIKNSKKEWRIFALALIAVTVVKLFTYDIGNVSQAGKIVAFIILGIVLLIISFMYQRIKKALFKDDEK